MLLGVHEARPYVVQYAETDWEFLSRILADEGIASFFDHAGGSAWTLVDDTSISAPSLTGSIPFSDTTQMNTDAPHVLAAVITSGLETSAVTLRDFDFEKPEFVLEAKKAIDATGAFKNETPLEAYTFEVGKFTTQAPGDARASRILEADRTSRRRVVCASSFALPPGIRMPLVDHPRADLAGDFLVVRARTVMEADNRGTHELDLIDLANRFRPALRAKARIHGTQTAFVVGASGEEIDVDKYGRVTTPLQLPKDKAISVWRSKSTPKSDGYNQILMDDQAGAERLEIHAQRDFKQVTERDSETTVGRNEKRTVKGNRSLHVIGNQTEKIDGDKDIDATGALDLHGKTVSIVADTTMELYSGAHMQISCGSNRDDYTTANHAVEAEAIFVKGRSGVQVVAPKIHVFGGSEIHLQVGGSSIHITADGIEIHGPVVDVKGSPIKLNT